MDFKSPKHLADYLIYLDKNKTAYNNYFKWKKHVSFHNILTGFNSICSMCVKLQLESYFGIENKIIENIGDHWSKSKNCKSTKIKDLKVFEFE